jgi:hypothetical protein
MNTHKYYFVTLFSFSLLLFLSCEKKAVTTINGTVIDATTGEPLDSAGITLLISRGYSKSAGKEVYEYPLIRTDQDGRFTFMEFDPISIFIVQRNGYISKGGHVVDIVEGQVNDVTIPMIPQDGTLRLNFLNPLSIADTVYFVVYSPYQLQEADLSSGRMYEKSIDMSLLNQYQLDLAVASGETLTVYWNFDHKPGNFKDYPFKDTLSVSKNGISPFTISL